VEQPVIIVLGASGFIGRNVSLALSSRGYRVHGVGHGNWNENEWSRWGILRWTPADITLAALKEAAKSEIPLAAIHCAGTGSVALSFSDPLGDYEKSVNSTAILLEFARCFSVKPRVVLISSAAVYGSQNKGDFTEDSTCSPVSPYGFNKLAAENICKTYSHFFGVPSTIVRLFSVYGNGLRKQLLWDAMNKFGRDEYEFFGCGDELRDWIHIEDASQIIVNAAIMQQDIFEIFNGAHTKASVREVLRNLLQFSGLPFQPRFNGVIQPGYPLRLSADLRRVQNSLNWSPRITLADGLMRYVTWFKDGAL